MKGTELAYLLGIAVFFSAFAIAGLVYAQEERKRPEVPGQYAGAKNPIPAAQSIAAGKKVYTINCASCHGDMGDGKGPAAAALEPKPADFTNADVMLELTDTYLFWRINEGGVLPPFSSAMPSWKGRLSEEDIWNVINYERTFSLEKPEAPAAEPAKEVDASKLGLELRAYSIGGIGIIATIILIIFAFIVIRKEGY